MSRRKKNGETKMTNAADVVSDVPVTQMDANDGLHGARFGVSIAPGTIDQPAPTKNDGVPIWEIVKADMDARDRVGLERYGVRLQANNGRNALVDAYQEGLDQIVYLRQAIEERGLDVLPVPHRAALVAEVARLQAREQELLETGTRLVEEKRGLDEGAMVRQFHRLSVVQPILDKPQVPSDERVRLRGRLFVEEAIEKLSAMFDGAPMWKLIESAMMSYVSDLPVRVDLPKFVDGCVDTEYIINGTYAEFGVDGAAVFRVVHAANLKKFPDGKPVMVNNKVSKPEGWTPPDIGAELMRQGWDGKDGCRSERR